jgi:2'-5' RNA ligase
MPRLFIAIELPPAVKAALQDLQHALPLQGGEVRVSTPEQMHLTLHFIGEADVAPLVRLLHQTCAPGAIHPINPFALTLDGLGHFRHQAGRILWAGVQPATGLLTLHSALAVLLQAHAYPVEARRYRPHITLARCKAGLGDQEQAAFLAQEASLPPLSFPVEEFCLYSSHSSAQAGRGPDYHCEQRFPLAG